ncbi:MAG: alkylhydroperoxidase-related (seleno)protein [Pseudomonadota bacterium]
MLIREDLTSAHNAVWDSLPRAGTWLDAETRIALACETRACRACALCKERKAALSPSIEGDHDVACPQLPGTLIELVHKLVTDPGRITRRWVDALYAQGLPDTHYVEAAALVSSVLVVDTFHAALGMPLRALPEPRGGIPTANRPRTACDEGAYVPMIAADALVDDYIDLYATDHWVPNVHRAFSLVPDATRLADRLMASHYLPYEQVPNYTDADHHRAIDKTQMELIASRVSVHNDCFY